MKPINQIEAMRERLTVMQNELMTLKGAEWDDMLNRINNLSVDIELKRRQKALRNSSAHFGDEQPVYHIPKN